VASAAVEILTIGDELLRGDVVDGNAAWLGRRLAAAGIRVTHRTTVGDDDGAIEAALRDALARTGVVLCTGGLGPTSDDRTKPVAARVFRRALHVDGAVLAALETFFRGRGRAMPPINRTQAEVPDGAHVFANAAGTAPGLALHDARLGLALLLPGVPAEVRALCDGGGVIDYLRTHFAGELARIDVRVLRTTGIAESALFEKVRELLPLVEPSVSVAFLPTGTGVDVRFVGTAAVDAACALFHERLARYIYTTDERDLADVVGARLRERRLVLAVAESCTGGLLAKRLTDVAGSSAWFDGGVISYADAAKQRWLGVSAETLATHGAVSEATALAMVRGIAEAAGAGAALSVTGVAGPGGGSDAKPVGTVWIGVSVAGRARAVHHRFGGSREEIRERAVQLALRLLDLELQA
jgi:nicotinamide-nucleotide amidase